MISPPAFHPSKEEVKKIHNTTTSYGGLYLFKTFWNVFKVDELFNKAKKKKSGAEYSDIMKNVTLGHIMDCNSLEELTDLSFKEDLLKRNCSVSRSTYSRNMNSITYNKQNGLLLNLVLHVINGLNFSEKTIKKAIGLLDASVIPVTGKTFEGARWVHDSRIDALVWGYEIMTLLIQVGKYSFPIQYRVNDSSKKSIIMMLNKMLDKFGITKISFDGGIKGMDYYIKLNELDFKFTTKVTKTWIFEKFNWLKPAKFWANTMRKFHRNHKYSSKIVSKHGMCFQLVVVKNDKRIFLTNDLDSKPKQIYDTYQIRWKIEESFREEKQNLGFESLTVRKRNAIRTHNLTVFIAFIFCQLVLAKFKTIKGIKLLIRLVFHHVAAVVQKANSFFLKFIENFNLKNKLIYLLTTWLM